MNHDSLSQNHAIIVLYIYFNFGKSNAVHVKIYYAYLEDFKRFMRFFRYYYPELYEKYKRCISCPEIGMDRPVINDAVVLRPVTRQVLTLIIAQYYNARYN